MKKRQIFLVLLIAFLFIGCDSTLELNEPLVVTDIFGYEHYNSVWVENEKGEEFKFKTKERITIGDTIYLKRK